MLVIVFLFIGMKRGLGFFFMECVFVDVLVGVYDNFIFWDVIVFMLVSLLFMVSFGLSCLFLGE